MGGRAQPANTFLKTKNSKGVRNKLKVYWLKCLSVSQANEATCGCDNEIAVKRRSFRPRNRRMILRVQLISLQKHNECHLESTMNTLKLGKELRVTALLLINSGVEKGQKMSHFNAVIMIFLFRHFTPDG